MTELEKQLLEALEHISGAIERQLELIAERAPGQFLDKRPVVQALRSHAQKANAAIATAKTAQPAPNYPAVPEGWLPQGDWQIPLAMSIAGHRRLKELTSIEPNLYEIDEVFRAMLAAAPRSGE